MAGMLSNVTLPVRLVPNIVMISPGATGPLLKLAAFVTPDAVKTGGALPTLMERDSTNRIVDSALLSGDCKRH